MKEITKLTVKPLFSMEQTFRNYPQTTHTLWFLKMASKIGCFIYEGHFEQILYQFERQKEGVLLGCDLHTDKYGKIFILSSSQGRR